MSIMVYMLYVKENEQIIFISKTFKSDCEILTLEEVKRRVKNFKKKGNITRFRCLIFTIYENLDFKKTEKKDVSKTKNRSFFSGRFTY